MKIFVDGDACSAQKIKQKFARKRNAEVVTVVSIENCTNIRPKPNTIVVDSTPQAADIENGKRCNFKPLLPAVAAGRLEYLAKIDIGGQWLIGDLKKVGA